MKTPRIVKFGISSTKIDKCMPKMSIS